MPARNRAAVGRRPNAYHAESDDPRGL